MPNRGLVDVKIVGLAALLTVLAMASQVAGAGAFTIIKGRVVVDGAPAADGTLVTAEVEGIEVGSAPAGATGSGQYSMSFSS